MCLQTVYSPHPGLKGCWRLGQRSSSPFHQSSLSHRRLSLYARRYSSKREHGHLWIYCVWAVNSFHSLPAVRSSWGPFWRWRSLVSEWEGSWFPWQWERWGHPPSWCFELGRAARNHETCEHNRKLYGETGDARFSTLTAPKHVSSLTTCWRRSERAQLLREQSSQPGQGRRSLRRAAEAPDSFQKSEGPKRSSAWLNTPHIRFR